MGHDFADHPKYATLQGTPEEAQENFFANPIPSSPGKSSKSSDCCVNRLIEIGKADAAQPNLFVPHSRFPAGVTALEMRWGLSLGVSSEIPVLLYHPSDRKFVGGYSLSAMGSPLAYAFGGNKLWVASQSGYDVCLCEIDPVKLRFAPRERWVADEVSSQELSGHVAALPEGERAVYDFFAGKDLEALQLLGTNEETLDAQSIFLITLGNRELGHPEQAAKFEEVNSKHAFPGVCLHKNPER